MKLGGWARIFVGLLALVFCILLVTPGFLGIGQNIPWPIEPQDEVHPVGNSFGEFQQYLVNFIWGNPYFHTGIDILATQYPNGPWVRAVSDGTVVNRTTSSSNDTDWGAIVESADGTRYWYWHLDQNSIQVEVGDAVNEGDQIGQLVPWPSASFHHLHFMIEEATGYVNPLTRLDPNEDTSVPSVEEIYIRNSETDNYFPKPLLGLWVISGKVDIIARVEDEIPNGYPAGGYSRNTGVYRITYAIDEINGSHDVSTTELYTFDQLPGGTLSQPGVLTVFSNSGTCDSDSSYTGTEEYFYIVTNSVAGQLDDAGCWDTTAFPPGRYRIDVTASDIHGSDTLQREVVIKNGLDAALVIDKSGSMSPADKLPIAKDAAKYFVEASQPGDQIAVSAFSSSGQLVAALTEIPNQAPNDPVKVGLKNAIDALTAGGSTNFGAGLQIAYDQLNGSTLAQDKFAVLMSNGEHNTGTYAGQVQAFVNKGWPIYTIGFGSNVNEATLRSIADDTGGKYYPADAAILTTIYALIRADMTGDALLTIMQWLLQQGQTIVQWLPPIGPLTTLLHFLLNWGGSDVDLILIKPDGTEITPADAALDPNITYHKTGTYAFYTVNNPMPGTWGVRVVGTDLPNPEVVTLSVTAASPLVFTFYGYQASYNPGNAIPIVVQLREQDRTPILGSNVQVEVTKPNGGKEILPLLDDGASNDALLSDGIYGNTFTDTTTEGFYHLDVTATGNYSGGAFNQKLIGIVLVGSPPAAGGWYDMEYVDQDAMVTAGWTFSGRWHLTTETVCNGFSPNPTPFPSSTHSAHFCGEGGTYGTPASLPLGAITPKQRAQQAQTGPKAAQAKSYGELITPGIPVTAQSQVDLKFYYFREVEYYSDGSYDQTYVQVKFDGGSWQTVWALDSRTASKKAWTEAGPITIPVPTGASVMRVKFVFDSVDSYGNDYLGWLIDDISVSGPQPVTLRIVTQGLPTGTVNQAYTATLSAAGGTAPYTWSATGLPSGLSLNASTGGLSGTPTGFGTFDVTATVTDSANNTATRDYQLTINPEPVGVLYEEDFTDPTGWTVGGLWHTTAALGCVNLTGYGTAAYYGIDAACDYDTNDRTTGELTSPAIDISGATAVQVRFDHFRQVEYFGDGAYDLTSVQVKLGDGSWQTAWSRDSTYISEGVWTQATVGPFATGGADTMQLRFVFDSVDRWANGFIGWLVDNVRVEAAASGGPLSAMAVQEASPRDVAELISVFNVPNPVRDVHTTKFVVRGVKAETLRVEIYDLTGRLVWEGEDVGNELPWHTEGFDGLPLANGVYLYRVIVRVSGDVISSTVQKLVILR